MDRCLSKITDKQSSHFVNWIPNRLMNSICSVCPPYKNSTMSGTSLFNATSIASTFRRVLENFQCMYRKKAYVH